ncbi:MAG TPA: NAD(P)H-dependent glycerol-3-phosphate dehydrogenase [Phycisphaerae bacterium]|nr:NAD(P)H-dependent glycerol-3-phosphate dehydrogenase [Phycisphaerae bacterium]
MPSEWKNISVLGDGAMGTVCALILADAGFDVTLWSNFPEQAADLQQHRENRRFLAGFKFPANISVTADPAVALAKPDLIVSAIPCQFIRSVWKKLASFHRAPTPVVAVSKGIEVETLMVSTQIIESVLDARTPVAALSGPSIAPELAAKKPCTVVAAAADAELATRIQRAFSNDYFRVYTNDDVIGVEISGATKNVIALAAGIIDGIDAGCNAKAALLTRGVVEIARLGEALGAKASTFSGLAGVGDLVTTCISPVGRNRSAGEKIGRGMTAKEAIADTTSVIEGIATTHAVLKLAEKHGVDMPITRAVAAVLDQTASPREAISALMTRELTNE